MSVDETKGKRRREVENLLSERNLDALAFCETKRKGKMREVSLGSESVKESEIRNMF